MDESLQELENELKRLTPRALSSELHVKLERELGPGAAVAPVRRSVSATSLRSWKWASWSLVGAAAAAALVFALTRPGVPETVAPGAEAPAIAAAGEPASAIAAENHYQPVHASTVLYDLQEGDPTVLPDSTEGREVRYRYVDTYTWKNPATNASVSWSLPRDEVRVVRTNFD